jgi:glycosyltransferase involved in cell wall biosynthesis
MKAAIVHDWFTTYAGGEKVVEALCELWPQADIFTLVYDADRYKNSIIARHKITASFIDHFPGGKKWFRHYFALYPLAVEQFDLRGYDLVFSSSAGFSHGVLTDHDQLHVCNKYTPLRYAWSGYHEYLADPQLRRCWKQILARLILHRHRRWDFLAAQRVDDFIAISREIQRRIWKYYRRTSTIIYPPVELEKFTPPPGQKKENFYFTISRLVPYKKIDLMVKAFVQMPHQRLVVAGEGPELANLKQLAAGKRNIEFIGFVSETEKVDLMRKARGFIFAAYEDFGIVPVEAQAAGTPVIAYGKGGSLETVLENKTGVFFNEQTPHSLIEAVTNFETRTFDPVPFAEWVRQFSCECFQRHVADFVETAMNRSGPENCHE